MWGGKSNSRPVGKGGRGVKRSGGARGGRGERERRREAVAVASCGAWNQPNHHNQGVWPRRHRGARIWIYLDDLHALFFVFVGNCARFVHEDGLLDVVDEDGRIGDRDFHDPGFVL